MTARPAARPAAHPAPHPAARPAGRPARALAALALAALGGGGLALSMPGQPADAQPVPLLAAGSSTSATAPSPAAATAAATAAPAAAAAAAVTSASRGAAAAPTVARYRQEAVATWRVTGVRSSSRLNARATPGTDARVVATLRAGQRDLVGTGRAATVGRTAWRQVRVPGAGTGWVAARHLAAQQSEPRYACRPVGGTRVCDTFGEHDEGPGTTGPRGDEGRSREDEGPGTATPPAEPVVGQETPGSYALRDGHAEVLDAPGASGRRLGTLSGQPDLAGTGRTATAGGARWVELRGPGVVGWVAAGELRRL